MSVNYKYSKTGTSILVSGTIETLAKNAELAAYESVAFKIIETIKVNNDLFFLNDHDSNELEFLAPRSFLTGKTYQDLNAFCLYFDAFKYHDPRFMLFATARKNGFKVQKGAKACKVIGAYSYSKNDKKQNEYFGKKLMPLFCAGNMQNVPKFSETMPKAKKSKKTICDDLNNLLAGYIKAFDIKVQKSNLAMFEYDRKIDSIALKENTDNSAIMLALAASTAGDLRLNRSGDELIELLTNEITAFLLAREFKLDFITHLSNEGASKIKAMIKRIVKTDESKALDLLSKIIANAHLAFNFLIYGYRTNWIDIKEKFIPENIKNARYIVAHPGKLKGTKKAKVQELNECKDLIFEHMDQPANRIKKARATAKITQLELKPINQNLVYTPRAPEFLPVDHEVINYDNYEPVPKQDPDDDLDYNPSFEEIEKFYSHIA